jgi:hypothetical protein
MNKLIVPLFTFISLCAHAQVYYSEDFEDNTTYASWISIDNDSDPAPASGINFDEWYIDGFAQYFPANYPISIGDHSASSRSWASEVAYTPDNIFISPAIDLTTVPAGGLTLGFNIGSIENSNYSNEHYSVYVVSSPDLASVLAATAMYSETFPDGNGGPGGGGFMLERGVDLSAYSGQTIYLVFRHHNCTNENTLLLDNIVIKTLANEDVSLEDVSLSRYSQIGSNNPLSVEVKNMGASTVTSLQINWNDGTDHIQTITTNIAPGATDTVDHPTAVSYASVVERNINVTISQVNGVADNNPTNNTGNALHNTVSQLSPKSVVIEEGTGTWCGWCPRGTVALNYMTTTYPNNFIGIAVHNDDPMMDLDYNYGAGIMGFPGANVDRVLLGKPASQQNFEQYYNDRQGIVVPASVSGVLSIDGSNLTVDAGAIFRSTFAVANFRLAAVVVEDDVTGTSSYYDQHNYFAGGAAGPMGGFENLTDPVPAADMVYDHVGRSLLGGYDGQSGSVPASITDGQSVNYTFNYTIPAEYDVDQLHVVVLLIDATTGEIVNAAKAESAASLDDLEVNIALNIYPNPASSHVNVSFIGNGSDYTVTLTDLQGRVISTNVLNTINGDYSVDLSVGGLAAGKYMVSVADGQASFNKMISVK